MRLSIASLAAAAGVASAIAPNYTSPAISQWSAEDVASGKAFADVSNEALSRMKVNIDGRSNQTCSYENAAVRTEFRNMTLEARKAFTDAVTCLTQTPPQVMTKNQSSQYPGVKSRHDEYVATHINMTFNVHMTADFLAWHRFYIWHWEQDLRNLCNYTGNLPYYDWALDAAAPQNSEVFNGDEYSFGSNGAKVANRTPTYLYTQGVTLPVGTGGGCVTSGPFTNYTVNMGPLDSPFGGNVNSSYQYNPRCLRRDFNPWVSSNYNTYTNVTELLLNQIRIEDFQSEMQGYGSPNNQFGLHGGGHWLGGDSTVMDFQSSPGDPLFFLHHAMIDRVWTIWQNLDNWDRQYIIRGTSTLNNSPPSPDMQLTDMLPYGFVTNDMMFHDLMDTMNAQFCYRYD